MLGSCLKGDDFLLTRLVVTDKVIDTAYLIYNLLKLSFERNELRVALEDSPRFISVALSFVLALDPLFLVQLSTFNFQLSTVPVVSAVFVVFCLAHRSR